MTSERNDLIGNDPSVVGAPVRAGATDVGDLVALRDAAAEWMVERGIVQWAPGEITAAAVAAQVARGEWWGMRGARGIAGALRLLWSDVPVWGERPADAAYVHGLVVARDRTGGGIGRAFLEWARRRALNAGRSWVRLDCVETNPALRDYYASAGYQEVGRKQFGTRWHPVVLLERPAAATGAARLSGLVLRCADLDRSAGFYRDLGLDLIAERHGNGPDHYSVHLGGTLIELYPATAAHEGSRVRLTLDLPRPAVTLTDPDGRRVEIASTPEA